MEIKRKNGKRVISLFTLIMLNVSIMASLRNLPLVAEYGYQAIFYFVIAGVFFLIPSALVSAELATGWPKSGGIYIWVREAFGDTWGFFAIWMQWIHNVTWYPAILSFVATTLAFIIDKNLINNPLYVTSIVLITFWGMTWLNCRGIKVSALFSTIGVIAGTIIPGLFIILLGMSWYFTPNQLQITFSFDNLIPKDQSLSDLVFMSGMLLAFAGLEVSAGYAGEVKNPQKTYPRSIIYAGIIVFFLFMLGSISIAVVIPQDRISLVSGLMDAFTIFLNKYHLGWMIKLLAALLIFGAVAEVNSWIIGPVKALYTTTQHGNLHPIFKRQNKRGVPVNLLIFQAIVVTCVSLVFPFMADISTAYWLLTAVSIQLYLIMYFLMFTAAIKLRYSHPNIPRAYKIPNPHKGMWLVASAGILASLFAFIIAFIPPKQLIVDNFFLYEMFIVVVLVVMSVIPLILHKFKRDSWLDKEF